MINAIFFDFDGVIMDSMDLKLDQYSHALQRCNFSCTDIRELHLLYTGLSRHKVLVLIYEQLSGKKITGKLAEEFSNRFAEYDERTRTLMRPVPGTLPFLEKMSTHLYTAIVTGTPQDAIEKTVTYHNLDSYFDDVRGSPQSKENIIEELRRQQNFPREQCIFIGDGKTDQEAAEACNIPFVGVERGDISFNRDRAWVVVSTLMDLLPYIGKRSINRFYSKVEKPDII